jgi:hypothetical protein
MTDLTAGWARLQRLAVHRDANVMLPVGQEQVLALISA